MVSARVRLEVTGSAASVHSFDMYYETHMAYHDVFNDIQKESEELQNSFQRYKIPGRDNDNREYRQNKERKEKKERPAKQNKKVFIARTTTIQ